MSKKLEAKRLLGGNDSTVKVLDRLDLTNAQKRDERFYPPEAVLVFNQEVRDTGFDLSEAHAMNPRFGRAYNVARQIASGCET